MTNCNSKEFYILKKINLFIFGYAGSLLPRGLLSSYSVWLLIVVASFVAEHGL